MKVINLQLVLLAAILTIVFSATGRAEDKGAPAFSKQELQAKLAYCQTCHGLQAQGFRGALPIPRLAGQQPEYIENQLNAFIERRRTNMFMSKVAHGLKPGMVTPLAEYFKDLNPKPLGGAPKQLEAAGKKIFEEGVPSANVPACASCHGEDGKGNGQFPRLAGQLNDYILSKLTNWNKERGLDPKNPDTSSIMEPITHGLTESQIKDVAAYVSYLD